MFTVHEWMEQYMKRRTKGFVVSEPVPVQVYLDVEDRKRLDWLTAYLGTSKADVVRQALRAHETQLRNAAWAPLMALAGIGRDRGGPDEPDAAVEHDTVIADYLMKRKL
jgi:hypothetical protein